MMERQLPFMSEYLFLQQTLSKIINNHNIVLRVKRQFIMKTRHHHPFSFGMELKYELWALIHLQLPNLDLYLKDINGI